MEQNSFSKNKVNPAENVSIPSGLPTLLSLASFPVMLAIIFPCSSFNGAPAPGRPHGLKQVSLGLKSRTKASTNLKKKDCVPEGLLQIEVNLSNWD